MAGKPGVGGGVALIMMLIQYGIPILVAASLWRSSWLLAIVVGIGLHVLINWAGTLILGLVLAIGMAFAGKSMPRKPKDLNLGLDAKRQVTLGSVIPLKPAQSADDESIERDPAVR